jgi:hypothetical protein
VLLKQKKPLNMSGFLIHKENLPVIPEYNNVVVIVFINIIIAFGYNYAITGGISSCGKYISRHDKFIITADKDIFLSARRICS